MGGPLVLAFNLEDAVLKVLGGLCAALDIRLKPVPPEGFALPLGAMAGIPLGPAASPDAPSRNYTEPMLVMCNLDEARFDAFLQALRRSPIPTISLKAVLTPTNVAWNACQLHGELCKERERFGR